MTDLRKTRNDVSTSDVRVLTAGELNAVAGGDRATGNWWNSLSPAQQAAYSHWVMSQQR